MLFMDGKNRCGNVQVVSSWRMNGYKRRPAVIALKLVLLTFAAAYAGTVIPP